MSDYLSVAYLPDPGVEPRATYRPPNDPIPAVYLSRQWAGPDLKIQFDPKTPADTVRYLRQLAAAAADLADQVENVMLPLDCHGEGHEIEAEVPECRTCAGAVAP